MRKEQPKVGKRSLSNQSRVTNGTVMHAGVDGRSAEARRYRDLVLALSEDIPDLDESSRSLVRRLSGLIVEAERLEGFMVSGQEFSRDSYITLCGVINRCQDRLNELKAKTAFWRSEKEKADREAWLNSLSYEELSALRDVVSAASAPVLTTPVSSFPVSVSVPAYFSDEAIASARADVRDEGLGQQTQTPSDSFSNTHPHRQGGGQGR